MPVSVVEKEIPVAGVCGESPLPRLRAIDWDAPLLDGGLSEKSRVGFAYMTGERVLPYLMQDEYTRLRKNEPVKTVVLENEHMRAVFLAEYGGRLCSLFDKDRERELLFVNPVLQCCNLAVRGAWFSGGIEWNAGQYGHSTLTCEPMFFARCLDGDGREFLRMYEYERIKGLYQQMDFHLDPDEALLYLHVRLLNSHKTPESLYYWTNAAVEQNRRVRIFSGAREVISTTLRPGLPNTFADDTMPKLKVLDGRDASFPEDIPFSTEYFFQNRPRFDEAWEVAAYNDGTAYFERSTPEQAYRKMFCWGKGPGGAHWQEFLSEAGAPEYIEVQSGIFPSQIHGGDIPGGASVEFTQVFGALDTDPSKTHSDDWCGARKYVFSEVESRVCEARLAAEDERFRALVCSAPAELLETASGWGALEELRQPGITPRGLVFPRETLGEKQADFVALLENGSMPELGGELPAAYLVDRRWLELYRMAVLTGGAASDRLLLHYALAAYENGEVMTASAALKKAEKLSGSPIIPMTLAMLFRRTGRRADALSQSRLAIERGGEELPVSFAREHIDILLEEKDFSGAWKFYCSLPEICRADEKLRLLAARAAYQTDEREFLEQQFGCEFACTREGETDLCELWFKLRAKDIMAEKSVDYAEAYSEALKNAVPPRIIDFRMIVNSD